MAGKGLHLQWVLWVIEALREAISMPGTRTLGAHAFCTAHTIDELEALVTMSAEPCWSIRMLVHPIADKLNHPGRSHSDRSMHNEEGVL